MPHAGSPTSSSGCAAAFAGGVLVDQAQRVTQLRQLRRLLEEQEERLVGALAADLGKPPVEAYATEIGFTIAEIDHALAGLPAWMAPERVKVPLTFKPGSARIVSQPLGVVLVIAPWNYPVQLSLAPMVAALAAGNTVVLKPSELAPATSAVLAELVPTYLDGRAVAVVEGGADVAQELLAQRFDHILYTGGQRGRQGRHAGGRRAPHAGHAGARRQEPGDRRRRRRRRHRRPPHRLGPLRQRRPDVRRAGLRARAPGRRGPVPRRGAAGGPRLLRRRPPRRRPTTAASSTSATSTGSPG